MSDDEYDFDQENDNSNIKLNEDKSNLVAKTPKDGVSTNIPKTNPKTGVKNVSTTKSKKETKIKPKTEPTKILPTRASKRKSMPNKKKQTISPINKKLKVEDTPEVSLSTVPQSNEMGTEKTTEPPTVPINPIATNSIIETNIEQTQVPSTKSFDLSLDAIIDSIDGTLAEMQSPIKIVNAKCNDESGKFKFFFLML